MRRKVSLKDLGVGRCFTIPVEPGQPEAAEESARGVRRAESILAPKDAWRVTAEAKDGVVATSAAGEQRTFAAETAVVEIQRQGYDKLLAR